MNTRRLPLVALVVAIGLALAGCSATGAASGANAGQNAPRGGNGYGFGNGGGNGNGNGFGGGFPGASGLVAAVSGKTAQVQSTNRQTAVTWTDSTRFTKQVAAASSDLSTGQCVIARPALSADTGSGSRGSNSSDQTVAAATIVMFAPANGSCAVGLGGDRPTAPNAAPTPGTGGSGGGNGNGTPRGGFGGFGATGAVKSLSDGSLVVTETRGGTTRDVTVSYTASTTFTTQKAGAASDVVVGACVLAQGKSDDTGALTASTISVSPAKDGTCTTGFGGSRDGRVPGPNRTSGTGSDGKNA